MPTFDLHCTKCGLDFEIFQQRVLRDEDKVCIDCGAPDAESVITGFQTSRPSRAPRTPPTAAPPPMPYGPGNPH